MSWDSFHLHLFPSSIWKAESQTVRSNSVSEEPDHTQSSMTLIYKALIKRAMFLFLETDFLVTLKMNEWLPGWEAESTMSQHDSVSHYADWDWVNCFKLYIELFHGFIFAFHTQSAVLLGYCMHKPFVVAFRPATNVVWSVWVTHVSSSPDRTHTRQWQRFNILNPTPILVEGCMSSFAPKHTDCFHLDLIRGHWG